MSILVGMLGAVLGGQIVSLFGGVGATDFNLWSVLVATLGAVILLVLFRLVAGRRAT